jgi:hypothetical protein
MARKCQKKDKHAAGIVELPLEFLAKPTSAKGSCAACCIHLKDTAKGKDGFVLSADNILIDKDCYETFWWAFRHKYNVLTEFLAALQNEPDVKDLFEKALSVKKGVDPPLWRDTEISANKEIKIVASKSLIGIPRADYARFSSNGATPEDDNVKLELLKDIHGNSFKGILCVDPSMPFTRYTYTREVSAMMKESRMQGGHQLHPDQAKQTFDSVVKFDCEDTRSWHAKFHTCEQSVEDVFGTETAARMFGGTVAASQAPSQDVASSSAAAPPSVHVTPIRSRWHPSVLARAADVSTLGYISDDSEAGTQTLSGSRPQRVPVDTRSNAGSVRGRSRSRRLPRGSSARSVCSTGGPGARPPPIAGTPLDSWGAC